METVARWSKSYKNDGFISKGIWYCYLKYFRKKKPVQQKLRLFDVRYNHTISELYSEHFKIIILAWGVEFVLSQDCSYFESLSVE